MMARARRISDASNIRIVRTESDSELAELDYIGFGDEDQLHRLIEGNNEMLFRGLTFLRRKFPSATLRTTVPIALVRMLNLKEGSILEWDVEIRDGRLVVPVRPAKSEASTK